MLPFGNRTVIETITGRALTDAVLNGLQPACNPAFAGGTGRFPQVSGLQITYTAALPGARSTPIVTGLWKAPDGPAGRSRRSSRPTPSASSPTTSCSAVATGTRR